MVIYAIAYFVRPFVTDDITRRYFIPALTLRIVGALALGFIYQFYYTGGDTFNYHTHGSRHLWNALWDSPEEAWRLFFNSNLTDADFYKYSTRIPFLTDPSSYTIVRLAFLFDLFTFSTYSSTALFFAIFSFAGMWMFFKTFYEQYPNLHRPLAFAAFFIPSVFFWGSGILKDTITLGCLGIAVYSTYRIFILRKISFWNLLFLALVLFGLYKIKIYIFLTFMPAAIVWVFLKNFGNLQPSVLRYMLFPFLIFITGALAYFSLDAASKTSDRYSIENLASTAQITAYDIRYYTGKDAGSGYALGELDGTLSSMFLLAPSAINVALFRPYLWEVKNPLMLLSAVESLCIFVVVLFLIIKRNKSILAPLSSPDVVFAMIFSITFAFAVGVSTFNFGTLVRYKIPMLPFFCVALTLIYDYSNRLRKLAEFELTE